MNKASTYAGLLIKRPANDNKWPLQPFIVINTKALWLIMLVSNVSEKFGIQF